MQPKINIALRAARRGARILANFVEELDFVLKDQVSSDEFLENAREQTEKEIFIDLKNAFGDHLFETEHFDIGTKEKETPHKWYISAVDSETNFKQAIPHFAISVVHTYQGVVEHAVIINPLTGIEFTASKGHGAYQNAKRIRSSELKTLEGAITAIYAPDTMPETIGKLLPTNIQPVINYSPLLNGAYCAAGKYDAAVLCNLSDYDKRAITLFLQEAGCLVCGLDGSAKLESGNIISAPAKLLKQLVKAVN